MQIPAEYHELRSHDPSLAQRWRDALADAIEACLGAGMLGAAFWRERSAYLFAREPLIRAEAAGSPEEVRT